MNKQIIVRNSWLLFTCFLFILSCTSQVHPEQERLTEAVKHAEQLSEETKFTNDTSRLGEAFTQKAIATFWSADEQEQPNNMDEELVYEKTTVEEVRIAEYTDSEAILIVQYGYELFVYNPQTGKHSSTTPPQRGWRTFRVKMVQEDGVWKYDDNLEFIDWGPRYD